MIIEDVCRIFFKVMLTSFINYGWWQCEDSESSKVLIKVVKPQTINNKVLRFAILNIKHLPKQLYLEVAFAKSTLILQP